MDPTFQWVSPKSYCVLLVVTCLLSSIHSIPTMHRNEPVSSQNVLARFIREIPRLSIFKIINQTELSSGQNIMNYKLNDTISRIYLRRNPIETNINRLKRTPDPFVQLLPIIGSAAILAGHVIWAVAPHVVNTKCEANLVDEKGETETLKC